MVQLLLLHDFNPDVHAKGGLTPLHLAVIKGQVDCVRALIDNGADITIKDDQGQDAITKAELLSKKHEAIVKYLCSKRKLFKKSLYYVNHTISLSRNYTVC